jgi:HAD superfamily phosphatase (TIGR01668 family)
VTPWLKRLAPTHRATAVDRLTPSVLRSWGVDALMVDLDNTVVAWDSVTPPAEVSAWIADLRRAGVRVCVVSNSLSRRAREAAALLGLPVARGRFKPSTSKLRDALRVLDVPAARSAIVGDQLFTDVLAGNRLGIRTVLTAPLSPREPARVRVVRVIERWLLAAMVRRGLVSPSPEV